MRNFNYMDTSEMDLGEFWERFCRTYPNMPDVIFAYITTCFFDSPMQLRDFVRYWNEVLSKAWEEKENMITLVFPLAETDMVTITFKRAYVEFD